MALAGRHHPRRATRTSRAASGMAARFRHRATPSSAMSSMSAAASATGSFVRPLSTTAESTLLVTLTASAGTQAVVRTRLVEALTTGFTR